MPIIHGLHSSTFTPPPIDGSLCLPALFDWQGHRSPKHPLFVFEDAPNSLRTILWEEGIQGIHRATEYVRRVVKLAIELDKPVIAILASSDTVTFATFLAGALRTGCTVFPISTRNSPAAVSALLSQTGTRHIFVSAESHNQDLVTAALNGATDGLKVTRHEMPVFEDLYPSAGVDPNFVPSVLAEMDIKSNAVIIHSSGTTAFPKPIRLKHDVFISLIDADCYCEVDVADTVWSFHALPLFHAMGLASISVSTGCGMIIAAFKPQFPAVVPNPVNVIEQARVTKCDYMFIMPTFIETWAQSEEHVNILLNMKGVMYAGGPLGKQAGDYLASTGLALHCGYGLTEALIISSFMPKSPGMDWEYFEICPVRKAHFIDQGDNKFEIVILATDKFAPSVINTNIDGQDGFTTGDLLSPHPTKKGFYRLVGRTDDQIMHSTGEKTNPGPLERILKRDPLIDGVLMFGRGRFQCGALVQPKEPFAFDPKDTKKLVEFRSLVWPTVEKMNAYAPSHSRLFKEMIIVTSPSKPIAYTAKGTIRRQITIKEYEKEIDAVYASVDESSQDGIPGPSEWSLAPVIEFVRNVVENTMDTGGKIVSDDTDLFEFGLDSLRATWIRNSLLRVLRDSQPSIARSFSPTFVYDWPTISRLAEFLCSVVNGASGEPVDRMETKRQELCALVDKYTQSFPTFKGGKPESAGRAPGAIVLLTGSTGSLGSNILAKLIEDPGVKRVYTMSRPAFDGISAKARHVKAFERESLEVMLLDDEKVLFLEGDAAHGDFGIDRQHFEDIQSSVTHIIHNGWRVNFNVAVSSFESNIRSVRNFIDFSLGGSGLNPARIIFISSIGVFQGYKEKKVGAEEHIPQPDSAIGTGYAESKWVSEHILQRASNTTSLRSTVARCGQMTGGPSGAWNEHEWFPSLVKSSLTLGKVPDVEGVVSFISAYDAGGAVVDMLDAKEEVLHVVHSRPIAWSSLIESFSKMLDIPAVPYADWLASLEEAAKSISSDPASVESAHRANPALRLLPFFRAFDASPPDETREALGFARLSCAKSTAVSPSLQNAEVLGEKDVERWVASWRKSGFLQLHI